LPDHGEEQELVMDRVRNRFGVYSVPEGAGWVMVADLAEAGEGGEIAALFRPEHAELAQEFADRLNVRDLAGRS
jgi:hypothetical protein